MYLIFYFYRNISPVSELIPHLDDTHFMTVFLLLFFIIKNVYLFYMLLDIKINTPERNANTKRCLVKKHITLETTIHNFFRKINKTN